MHLNAQQVFENTNRLFDWRDYVRQFPKGLLVAGLLTGQDFIAVKDQVKGDFAIIPRVTIKSDEPIFLDGMTYEDVKSQFTVPVYDVDTNGLIAMLKSEPPA